MKREGGLRSDGIFIAAKLHDTVVGPKPKFELILREIWFASHGHRPPFTACDPQ